VAQKDVLAGRWIVGAVGTLAEGVRAEVGGVLLFEDVMWYVLAGRDVFRRMLDDPGSGGSSLLIGNPVLLMMEEMGLPAGLMGVGIRLPLPKDVRLRSAVLPPAPLFGRFSSSVAQLPSELDIFRVFKEASMTRQGGVTAG